MRDSSRVVYVMLCFVSLWLFLLWGFKYLELEIFTLDLMEEKDNLFKCHSGSSFYFMGGYFMKKKEVYKIKSFDIVFEVYDILRDEDIEDLVLEALRRAGKPLDFRELRKAIEGLGFLVGVDKLRKVLKSLILRDKVVEMIDGSFGLQEMVESYVPKLKERVVPLVSEKFMERWGDLIEAFGGIRGAVVYLRNVKLGESS